MEIVSSLQCPPLRPTTLLPVRVASIPTPRTATGRSPAPTALASTGTAKSNSTQDFRAHALRQHQKRCRRRDPDNKDDDDAGQGQRRGDDDESDDDSNDSDDNGGGSGQLARADEARTLSPQLSSASASGARSLPPRPGTTSASASAPGFSSGHSALTLPPRPRPRGRRSKENQAKQNARRQLETTLAAAPDDNFGGAKDGDDDENLTDALLAATSNAIVMHQLADLLQATAREDSLLSFMAVFCFCPLCPGVQMFGQNVVSGLLNSDMSEKDAYVAARYHMHSSHPGPWQALTSDLPLHPGTMANHPVNLNPTMSPWAYER
ncbi:hypothetical protein CF336_g4530 [Tilletia laevis]|uniref:Uncharacterized protein n=1 Tax=Tilletia caries TaxID=13290 RepID=A0A8T8SV09_9BASI|nr:hypothetical protein CF335_g6314 [Tilletia laevis]KAE8192194.1 hypothetical protein CF336_g4530 [Tilletia laevis]KAE8247296.1 hypothetical protein A4X03_0g7085 [Tilletia caries]